MNLEGMSSLRRSAARRVLLLVVLGMFGLATVSCGGGSSQPPTANGKSMNKINLSSTPNLNCLMSGISALNESTGKLYVSCVGRGIGVIDTGTMRVASIIPIEDYVNKYAVSIDVDKASNQVFVGQNINCELQDKLIVIDGVKDAVSDTIGLTDYAYAVLCDSGRGKVHVMSDDMIFTYDVSTHALKSSVSIAHINTYQPQAVLRGSTGHIFVQVDTNKSREYDPDTGTVVHEYNADSYRGIAVDDDGGKLFLAAQGSPGKLSVVDISTGAVDAVVSLDPYIRSVAYDDSLDEVYVLDPNVGSLAVVDPSSANLKALVAVKSSSMQATLARDEIRDKVYVINSGRNIITKIDGLSHSVEQRLVTGLDVSSIAVNSRSKKVFVMENSKRELYTFDAASGAQLGKASVYFEDNDDGFRITGINESADKVYIQGRNSFGIYDAGSALDFTDVYFGGLSGMAFDESQQVLYYTKSNRIGPYEENKLSQSPAFQYSSDIVDFGTIDTAGERNRLYATYIKLLPTGVNTYGMLSTSAIDGSIIKERTITYYPVNIIVDSVMNTTALVTLTPSLMNYYLELVDNENLVSKQTVSLGGSASGLDLYASKHWLYVTDYLNDLVSVFDMGTAQKLKTIATGPQPKAVAVDRITGTAYVLNSGDGSISVIAQ